MLKLAVDVYKRQVLDCPSQSLKSSIATDYPVDYAYNADDDLSGKYTQGWGLTHADGIEARSDSEITLPAETAAFFDAPPIPDTIITYDYDEATADLTDWALPLAPIHSDGVNFVYCDGHAKWSKLPVKVDVLKAVR